MSSSITRRDTMALRRVHEPEEDEVGEPQLPLRREAAQEAVPVERLGAGPEHVRDVRAVVALALHDERLLPEQLFDGRDLHRHSEHVGFRGEVEPIVVDAAEAVARCEDQVHRVVALFGLREPVRKGDLGMVSALAERAQSGVQIGPLDEEIEVLRLPDDAGVVEQRVRSPDEKGDASVAEHVKRAAIECVRVAPWIVEGRLVGHTRRKCNSGARCFASVARNVLQDGSLVSELYQQTAMPENVLRVAALSDIHYNRTSQGSFAALFSEIAEAADVLVLAGDLTDYGLAEEARILAKDLAAVKVPVVGVLGNHDFEADEEGEISRILGDVGVHILDGDSWEDRGVGFAGDARLLRRLRPSRRARTRGVKRSSKSS